LIPLLIHLYIYTLFSKMKVYNEIQLGDNTQKVDQILSAEGLYCGNNLRLMYSSSTPMRCYISDPWRTYEFGFNRRTGAVTSKHFYWSYPNLRRESVLSRIAWWFESHFGRDDP
jgi:hypothetical protein